MSNPDQVLTHLSVEQHTDHQHLMRDVATAVDHGRNVPCLDDPDRWEAEEWRTQRLAAQACGTCPVLEPCRTYATRWTELANVWGGLTASDRREMRHR